MRCLILMVFLAIAQTPSPGSRKATDSTSGTGPANAKDGNDNTTPVGPSPSIANPIAMNPDQNASSAPEPQDAPQSERVSELPPLSIIRNWSDLGILAFTALLVLVGLLQWFVIRTQAKLMREHAGHLENLAVAAKENAIAARKSADALVSSERAWLLAEIGNLPDLPVSQDTMAILYVMPTFVNRGRTVARIKRFALRQHQIPKPGKLPSEPAYSGESSLDFILPPDKPIQMLTGNTAITPQEYMGINQGEVFLYIYGFVDYLDIGEVLRQTRFCFVYHAPHGGDPTPRGFYPDLSAPLTYAKCT